jgi:soluble lytic murein transglycosylase-like protein
MRRSQVGYLAGALAVLVLAVGCGLGGHGDPQAYQPAGTQSSATDSPYETDPSPERTAAATKAPSKKPKAKPKATVATPTEDPNNFQLPACAHHEGVKVSKSKAKAALVAAAGKTYWPTTAPELRLSSDLVKSVAWHESGWQSDIVNCDGGRGLMQVMPDTVDMINNRFGQSYDAHDYKQNAIIGANYLAWLTGYFGNKYFKSKYDLSPGKCRTHASPCLLNMVISGYNAGFGSVDSAYARNKSLPNPGYVDSVRSLMSSCYCDRY